MPTGGGAGGVGDGDGDGAWDNIDMENINTVIDSSDLRRLTMILGVNCFSLSKRTQTTDAFLG